MFQASKCYISIIVDIYQVQESKHYRLFVHVRKLGHIPLVLMPLLLVQQWQQIFNKYTQYSPNSAVAIKLTQRKYASTVLFTCKSTSTYPFPQ